MSRRKRNMTDDSKPLKAKSSKSLAEPGTAGLTILPERPFPWKHVLIGVGLLGCVIFSLLVSTRLTRDRYAKPADFPQVQFINVPPWMSPALLARITESVAPVTINSSLDHELLVQTTRILENHPWIDRVTQVRRVFEKAPGDLLVIDASFRVPIALVGEGDYFWLVDQEGFKLPEKFTKSELDRIGLGNEPMKQLRTIVGVRGNGPQVGEKWEGSDLRAGLDMIAFMGEQSFLHEIVSVDVSNFSGRLDSNAAQIVLKTVRNSEIRWGLPLNGPEFYKEPTPQQKLAALRAIYGKCDRIDAGQAWVDIRFDTPQAPREGTTLQAQIER